MSLVVVRSLEVEGLTFSYGERAVVEEVSFRMGSGEFVALVGPNGCGKSTLLRLLLGELSAVKGMVKLDGEAIATYGRNGMARRMALVPQQMGGGMGEFGYTVREMVLMGRHAMYGRMGMGFETRADLEIAERAMWAADVHHLVDRPVNTLSGGERQRVAIARAFTQETPVLLLDEPTSALDLFHQLELLEQLRAAVAEGQMVLLVTHDLNLAAAHAGRVIVMDRGRVAADGATREVLVPEVLEPVYQVKVSVEAGGALAFSRAIGAPPRS